MIDPHPDLPGGASPADLVQSELRYRRLFESARDGVLILDPATRKIIEANPFMSELLGYSRNELVGRELFEIGLMKDETASRAAFAELQAKGYIRYEDLPLKTKSGESREVEFVSNLYPEGENEVIQSNIRDITARKRAEREVEEKARLLDLTNDAIIVRDLKDKIRFWNGGAERLFGWKQDDVLGKPLHKLLEAQYGEALEQITAKLYAESQFTGEVVLSARDGRRIPCLCRWILDAASGSILASYTDISELKAAEVEMADSRDRAIASGRAKDDFFAALSHELRTPLTPVLLLASDAAEDPEIPAATRELFATIARNVALEARLIDDLLDVSRMNHGKMVIERHRVDVHLVLRDAIATVQGDLKEKQLTLQLKLMAGSPVVMGDPVRLQQIFWNVLRNAQKFTPVGGRITISTRVLSNGKLGITITDSGIGMTTEELNRIFTTFSQGDHGKFGGSPRFGGLGLGLSVSRRLTEMHAGTIRADSPGLNQGSTFVVELTLAPAPGEGEPPAVPGSSTLPTHAAPAAHAGPTRILLVEDHDGTRTTLTRLLTGRNYDVVAVATRAEAEQAALGAPFDILISDIGLVDGTGYELMADLQARYGLKGIAITGFGEAEDIARSQAAGFTAHVTKPASIQSLEHALNGMGNPGTSAKT